MINCKRMLRWTTVSALLLTQVAWADPTVGVPGAATPVGVGPAVLPAGTVLHKVDGRTLVTTTVDGQLAVYDISDPQTPLKRSERDLAGTAVELRVADGVVFAVVARSQVEAYQIGQAGQLEPWRPALQAPSMAQVAAKPQASTREVKIVLGKVASVQRGAVLIELDEAGALRPGDAVLVRSQRQEKRLNLFTNREEEVVSNAPVATLEVRQVRGTQAVAELDRGDEVSVGDTVERTERRQGGVRWFAPRAGYDMWVRGTIRPFPNFGELDVGSLVDLAAGYYWNSLHIQARLSPLALSVPHPTQAYNAQVIASYQNDWAEFGLGTGYISHQFQASDEFRCTSSGYSSATAAADVGSAGGAAPPPTVYDCRQSGPSVVQHLRLGSVDGLNLRLTSTLAVNGGQFRFGYIDGGFDIPLSRTLNLYGAGGGSTGIAWGEAGIRTYVRGVGGRDTLILTTGIGGTAIRTAQLYGYKTEYYDVGADQKVAYLTDEKDSVGGLHLAIGLEWRR